MKNVILTPNPYRDKNFQTVREAMRILKDAGISTRLCLPFEVDRAYDLPRDLRFSRLDRELPNAEMVICFGGEGTILDMAKEEHPDSGGQYRYHGLYGGAGEHGTG